MMEFTLLEGAMGVGSGLFPLIGKLEKLKGFYPARRRNWYVVISTIFSLLVYAFIQFFEKLQGLPFFIQPLTSGLWAFVFLMIYLAIHLLVKYKYYLGKKKIAGKKKLKAAGKTAYIITTLVLYVLFIASLTHSFNALENYRDYEVIEGAIKYPGEKKELKATIKLILKNGKGEAKETHYSKKNGTFLIIIKKEKFSKITGVEVTFGDLYNYKRIDQYPRHQKWDIELREELNH